MAEKRIHYFRMKKATSDPAANSMEERLRAATIKALATDKAAQAEKEKARAAKRQLKQARKIYKQAKKAARKALKRARQAQEELTTLVDKAAKARRKAVVKQTVKKKSAVNGGLATRKTPAQALANVPSDAPVGVTEPNPRPDQINAPPEMSSTPPVDI